ncbi:MAG: hypothetical protein ABSB97_06880 [Thermoplasmata archaeon]|jgi:hypothetical protein
MAACPACGTEVGDAVAECPHCHLGTGLFAAVRDAAGTSASPDPTYLRTIGELLATVDLDTPSAPSRGPAQGLLSRPSRFPALPSVPSTEPRAAAAGPRTAPGVAPLRDLPALPAAGTSEELRHRIEEYFQLGRRLGLDFTDFEVRSEAAALVDDLPSLEVLAREMFVHVASAIAEEFEGVLARRNELAQLVSTASVDVELNAIRQAIGVGDLNGAQRRLFHVRDELLRVEEQWEVGRILVTECDLLVQTLRDLGGDPTTALGPLEEGRRCFGTGHRADAERLLARAAVALWTLLQPRFFEDLRRLRDRMVELRSSGVDVSTAVKELREVAAELRQRNFVGTVISYRRLKAFIDRAGPPEGAGTPEMPATVRPTPSS